VGHNIGGLEKQRGYKEMDFDDVMVTPNCKSREKSIVEKLYSLRQKK